MKIRSTTILTVRHKGQVAIGGDGQVTLGTAIMKGDALKIRRLGEGEVICGFAGSAALPAKPQASTMAREMSRSLMRAPP